MPIEGLQAVLFDLDGTLADTAPDLGHAANRLLVECGHPPLPLTTLRPYTSQGVRGLLHVSFGIGPADANYAALAERFLAFYAERLCEDTRLFDGIPALLDRLEASGIAWGIVTNKRERFTNPLMRLLELDSRTPCIVSGDTTPEAKPSPLPLQYACKVLGCAPEKTVYVGDDLRDIQAGRAAGCHTVAVAYGYLGHNGAPEAWAADRVVPTPHALTAYLLREN